MILVIKADLQSALDEIRDLSRGLHPAALQQGGLASTLENVANGLPFETEINVDVAELAAAHETAIYYIVCEALSNAAKHAKASHVRVDILSAYGAPGVVVVTDDGRGGAAMGGVGGLRGMADRVGALGGTLTLHSVPGNGTTVRVNLPARG